MKKLLIIFFLTLSLSGCKWWWQKEAPIDTTKETNVVSTRPSPLLILQEYPQYASFYSLIQKSGLEKTLADSPALTLFVPSNDALRLILEDKEMLDKYMSDPKKLAELVQSHIIPEIFFTKDLREGAKEYKTLSGEKIKLEKIDGANYIEKVVSITGMKKTENGNVYEIDSLLFPKDLRGKHPATPATPATTLTTYTGEVIAPTGELTPVPTATPVAVDMKDKVSAPPQVKGGSNVVDIMKADGRFTLFLGLLEKSNLLQGVIQAPELTIFAPTDDALRPVLADQKIAEFLVSSPYILPSVLTTHITTGKVTIQDLLNLSAIETLSGVQLAVTKGENQSLFLGADAQIIEGNFMAKNGVVHALNKVILPEIPAQ